MSEVLTFLWGKNELISSSTYLENNVFLLSYSLLFMSKYKIIGDGFRRSISIQETKKTVWGVYKKMTLKSRFFLGGGVKNELI